MPKCGKMLMIVVLIVVAALGISATAAASERSSGQAAGNSKTSAAKVQTRHFMGVVSAVKGTSSLSTGPESTVK